MPTKRKRSGVKVNGKPSPGEVDRRDGRVKRIERWGDDMDADEDTQDAFELQQDRISVDFGEQSRRQRAEDADALGAGDEVLALDLPSSEDDDDVELDEGAGEEESEDEEEEDEGPRPQRIAQDHRPIPSKTGLSRYARPAQDDDDDASIEGADITGAYHVGRNEDDEPDSSDEEAVALNLAENLRLQRAARAKLVWEDYAVPEPLEEEEAPPDPELLAAPAKAAPSVAFPSRDHAIAHMLTHSPETLALVDDFGICVDRLAAAETALRQSELDNGPDGPAVALANLYHHVLLTYVGTLAFYFRILATTAGADSALKTKVLHRITQLRQAVASLDEQGVGDPEAVATTLYTPGLNGDDEEEDSDDDGVDELEMILEQLAAQGVDIDGMADNDLAKIIDQVRREMSEQGSASGSDSDLDSVDDDEEDEEDEEVEEEVLPKRGKAKSASATAEPAKRLRKRKRKPAATPTAPPTLQPPTSASILDPAPPPKKKVKRSKLAAAPATPVVPPAQRQGDDDLLDPVAISTTDAADKAAAKKTLRFHARRIDQTAARRNAARSGGGAAGVGGDDDVPYRSKERARAAVLQREQARANAAAKAGGKKGGVALDGEDWGEADWGAAEGVNERPAKRSRAELAEADAQGYYDLVKRSKQDRAEAKQAEYDAARDAERAELAEALATDGGDGPRAISRAILANKGLTPKRAKANRNPRVKKKLRYDKAKKKVASSGRTAFKGRPKEYEGEKSGISRRTVKSTKLGGA